MLKQKQLLAFSLIIIVACAQEHLTCLRTDEVLNPSTQQPPTNILRRFRGKQGPKGDKGDPGIPDNSQINSLRDELNTLRQQLQAIQANINTEKEASKNQTADLLRGYSELEGGWISPFNGYQYKITLTSQSWPDSRRTCQNLGGDLIVHGVRDTTIRNAILRGLSMNTVRQYWIGLTDRALEGTFVWLNGEEASTTDDSFWSSTQPNGGDCCNAVYGWNRLRVFDDPCAFAGIRAICEKPIQN